MIGDPARLGQDRVAGERQVVCFEGHRPVGDPGQRGSRARRELAIDEHRFYSLDRASRLDVAPIGEQQNLLVFHQHKRVRALEPA